MKWLSFALFSIVALLALGGCQYEMRPGSLGSVRAGDRPYTMLPGLTKVTIIPDNELVCINGIDLLADIYIGGDLIIEALGPGEIESYPLTDAQYGDGSTIIVTAFCYRDDVLVCKYSKPFTLRSRGEYKQLEFEIERPKPIRIYGDFDNNDLIVIPPRRDDR